jgi:drug/metabolite transporter (DMT)-like permease
VGLSVAGLLLMQALSVQGGSTTLLGNVLVAGAVLCEAGKRLAPPYRPLRLALATNLAALVLAMPRALLDAPNFDPRAVAIKTWLLGILYALSASVCCLWLWYAGLPHAETWLAGLATAAMPVAALATSALYLGECLGPARIAGAVGHRPHRAGALSPTAPYRR